LLLEGRFCIVILKSHVLRNRLQVKNGFVIEMNTTIADILEEFSYNKNKIQQMQEYIFQFYNTHFSKITIGKVEPKSTGLYKRIY
jgi:hypothetical protein